MDLGLNKFRIKIAIKMTQEEVAKLLGCSQPFLSKWLNGKTGVRPETAVVWGKRLGIDPWDIIFGDVSKRQKLIGIEKQI